MLPVPSRPFFGRSMNYISSSDIRKAIGEEKAQYLEQNGSILPPHPGMLNCYMLAVILGNPITEEVLSPGERAFRKQEAEEASTKALQVFQNVKRVPIPPVIKVPFKESDYYQEETITGLNPSFVCAHPKARPYYLNNHFSLSTKAQIYAVQFFALFETFNNGHGRNDSAYAMENFTGILLSSLSRYNTEIASPEGIVKALRLTFSVFRDRIESVGYKLRNTTAAAAIIIDNHLWTINVGPSMTFISSKETMEKTRCVQSALESSTGSVQRKEDLWASARITMTAFEDIPKGSVGVIGSRGLFSKISPKNVCNGLEVYLANRQDPPASLSDIAINMIFSARQYRKPIENASVLVFGFQTRRDSEEYVFI